jgi:hypothetical protein
MQCRPLEGAYCLYHIGTEAKQALYQDGEFDILRMKERWNWNDKQLSLIKTLE